jgi:transcriptional regulator with XRE-family HTH domain
MKDFSTIELKRMTDDMIIQAMGAFVRFHRLEQDLTQEQLAERAGLHRTTIRDLELGKRSTLLTLIQVLRSLDQLQALQHFKVSNEISPLQLAKWEAKQRKRASGNASTRGNTSLDW